MTFGKLVVFLIAVILGLVLIGAILIGTAWYQVQVYRPWKNERNAATAHAWNEDYWANGNALEVTLTLESSGPDGVTRVHETLLCTAKFLVLTGGLKNSPQAYVQVYTTGPDSMALPIGEGVTLRADIRNACKKAYVAFDRGFADHLRRLGLFLRVESTSPNLMCLLGNRTGATSTNTLEKPYISNINPIPVNTFMERSDFEIIEASDPTNQANRGDRSLYVRNHLYWKTGLGCWTGPRSEICNEAAEQICGSQ